MSLLAAGAVFFGWNELEAGKRYQLGEYLDLGTLKAADGGEGDMMQWGDAIGLGAFAVIGMSSALCQPFIHSFTSLLYCLLCPCEKHVSLFLSFLMVILRFLLYPLLLYLQVP